MEIRIAQARAMGPSEPEEGRPIELMGVTFLDDAENVLFEMFVDPTPGGCTVQIDAPEDRSRALLHANRPQQHLVFKIVGGGPDVGEGAQIHEFVQKLEDQ